MRIRTKIFLSFFIIGLILTVSSSIVFNISSASKLKVSINEHLETAAQDEANSINSYFSGRKGDISVLSKSLAVKKALDKKTLSYTNLAKTKIKQKSKSTAKEVENYLREHPDKTIKDLQSDSQFQEIAVQQVGETGYTALTDYETLIARFHKNSEIVNLDLHTLASKLPGFWSVMSKTEGGKIAEGFYDWEESNGSIKKKYMYISIVDVKTADDVGLSVAATTYLDEYGPTMTLLGDSVEYIQNFQKAYDYKDVFLVGAAGDIWWTVKKESELGTNLIKGSFKDTNLAKAFQEAKSSGEVTVSDYEIHIHDNRPVFFIAAPVYNSSKLIGVVISEVNIDQIDEIMQESTGLGETGETYLVGQDYLMRSDSRFSEESTILKQKVETENARNCFLDANLPEERDEVESHKVNISINYRGVSILGAHVYLPELKMALLAEIDESEALAPLNELLLISLLIGLVLIILIFLASYRISSFIGEPVRKLRRGMKIVQKGDLNYKVGTKSKDEIGQLSRSFDEMTTAIKKSRAEVDKKVKKQTQEIVATTEKIENQQKATLNILEDVEEEKDKVSKEKEKINTILYGIGDGVFVIDKDYKITIFNQVASDISGFTPKEAIGKKYNQILKFIYEKNGKVNDKFVKQAFATGKITAMANHTMLVRKNGENIPVADSAAPLKNKKGVVIGCVVVFRDVTEERQIAQMKDDFLSIASHELRTPMTAIKGFLDMVIKGEVGKVSNPKIKEYLELAYDGNDRMIKLVNDMLNASRIEAGRMKFILEDVQVEKIIQESVTELTEIARPAKIYLKFKKPKKSLSKIIAAKDKVRMVLSNLIGNAIKFTEKGGVTVSVEEKEKNIIVHIKDTGVGIAKEDLKKLFKKFSQVDASISRSGKGTGLGLYISKRIVNKLGGKIWIDSKGLGKGTTTSFSLPIKGSSVSKKAVAAIKREAMKIPDQK